MRQGLSDATNDVGGPGVAGPSAAQSASAPASRGPSAAGAVASRSWPLGHGQGGHSSSPTPCGLTVCWAMLYPLACMIQLRSDAASPRRTSRESSRLVLLFMRERVQRGDDLNLGTKVLKGGTSLFEAPRDANDDIILRRTPMRCD